MINACITNSFILLVLIFLSVSEIYSSTDSLYGDMITLTCQTIEIPLRSTTTMNIDWSQENRAPIDSESGAVIDPKENIDGVYHSRNLVFRFLRPIQDGMYVCQVHLGVANSNKVFTEMDEYYLEVIGAWCIYYVYLMHK